MLIKHKVWLERNGRVIFGEGREALLKAIMEHHSLNAAIKAPEGVDMSYRAAWGRLKASQERLGIKLIDYDSKKDGTFLTEDAKKLLLFFEKLNKKVDDVIKEAEAELAEVFPKESKK